MFMVSSGISFSGGTSFMGFGVTSGCFPLSSLAFYLDSSSNSPSSGFSAIAGNGVILGVLSLVLDLDLDLDDESRDLDGVPSRLVLPHF